VAKEKDLTPAQLALAWLLHKKNIASPIIGPTQLEQLEELAEAVDVRLRSYDMERLEEPYRPHPVLGHE
jgi:aryl-alcohol dehydrogenase (NADP+)